MLSIENTDKYSFIDLMMKADFAEEKTGEEAELLTYADAFKNEFDGMWLSKESLDNNDTLAEKIKNKPSTSAPNSSLSILGKKFKDDGGTIEKVLIQGTVEANREYPVEFTIRRKGIEKTFTCNIGFFDHTSDDGKILAAKYNIQCKKWDFREDGIYVLYETSVVYPYGVAIDGWTSSNEELISIQNSNKAEVRG